MKGARKLAAAMRRGAKLRPQIRGGLSTAFGTCAIGAAKEAIGCIYIFDMFRELDQFRFLNPANGVPGSVWGIIAMLNDDYGWTREAIADWLDSEADRLGEPRDDHSEWATEQVRKLLEGTPSEAVNSPAESK